MNPPKLISNEESLFIKSDRFTLLPNKNINKSNSEKHIDLQICPVKSIDTGWYTCYIVKKSLFDQNIKYYTYLNVIENEDLSESFKCDLKTSNSSGFKINSTEPEIKPELNSDSTTLPVFLTNLERKLTPIISTSAKTTLLTGLEQINEKNHREDFYSEFQKSTLNC